MVGAVGFEPTAPCSQSRCATGLRYAPFTGVTLPWTPHPVKRPSQRRRARSCAVSRESRGLSRWMPGRGVHCIDDRCRGCRCSTWGEPARSAVFRELERGTLRALFERTNRAPWRAAGRAGGRIVSEGSRSRGCIEVTSRIACDPGQAIRPVDPAAGSRTRTFSLAGIRPVRRERAPVAGASPTCRRSDAAARGRGCFPGCGAEPVRGRFRAGFEELRQRFPTRPPGRTWRPAWAGPRFRMAASPGRLREPFGRPRGREPDG